MSDSMTSAATGNSFLDTLNGLVNTGFNALDRYTSFLSARDVDKVQAAQTVATPDIVVNVPASQGFLSNTENLQKGFLYAGGAGMVAILAYYIIKKL